MKFGWQSLWVVFGLGGLIPAGLVAQTPPPQVPVTPRTLSIATLAPVGSTWMRAFEAWNREIRRRTHGELSLRLYPNGVQGDEDEVVEKIRRGRLDGGAMTAVGLAMIHRPTLAFQLPGMFNSYEELDRARNALRPELDAAYHEAGFELLGWGDAGTDRMFSNRAIHTPRDMTTTRTFLWRDDLIGPVFLDVLGAHSVLRQVGEVLTDLSVHQIDTLSASPIAVVSFQWATYVTHMTDISMGSEIGAIVIGRHQFEQLPEEHRTILRELAAEYSSLLVRNVRHDDDSSIPSMVARGLQVVTPSPAEAAQWQTAFARTRQRLTSTDAPGHRPLCEPAFVDRILRAAAAPSSSPGE